MIEIFVKRYQSSIEGDLSFIRRDNSDTPIEDLCLRNIKIRSGQKPTLNDWQRGVSGCPVGKFLLWTGRKYIRQYNDLNAEGKEIARFYPISSGIDNHRLIKQGGKTRNEIGLHDENDYPGSQGCIVVVNNTDWLKLCTNLDMLTDAGVQHIPITVFKGEQ